MFGCKGYESQLSFWVRTPVRMNSALWTSVQQRQQSAPATQKTSAQVLMKHHGLQEQSSCGAMYKQGKRKRRLAASKQRGKPCKI